jgi:CobQ/CobB/MinD/ParA family nucleotide binding protein
MPCKVIFTAGAKGGSGKTTAACFILGYLRQHDITPLIMDLDDESKSLSRFYPEAVQVNIHQEFAHDVLIERATSDQHALIVADLKAGTGYEVLHWFLDVPFGHLRQEGVEFVCIGSITTAPDSVQSFLNWPGSLGDRVSYVVFKNLKDGDQLFDYESSIQAAEFRKRLSPAHITIRKLSSLYQAELEIRRLTFFQVLEGHNGNSSDGQPLGPILGNLMARARLQSFQGEIFEQFDAIATTLLPRQ